MKIEVTKDWCKTMAQREADAEVGAGFIAADPIFDGEAGYELAFDESRIALGRFVHLMRRQRKLSLEQLAEAADVDVGELMSIEVDAHHLPEPRTMYQLANIFGVSQRKLMGLSGLTRTKDVSYVEEAVRYAARSESLEELSAEEQAALDGLILVLSEK